mmetsp:Transcript_28674/g.51228  ORF Transcript_28674/g.51228 Transcript_28674/m.51228 type:complete len:204 (+) Transcript_28674:105-716(+)
MGCSVSRSIQEERFISSLAQVVPAHAVGREAFPPPRVSGRKSSHAHKTAARGGKQTVLAAWQDYEAQAKSGSLKVKDREATLAMRTPTAASDAESTELKSFNEATVVPKPSGLKEFSSFTLSPGKAEQEAGHALAPCSQTHKRWMKNLNQAMTAWERSPSNLEVCVRSRREDLDQDLHDLSRIERKNSILLRRDLDENMAAED